MTSKRAWLMARESADPMLYLATLNHPTFAAMRLVRDVNDITSRGDVYSAAGFDLVLDADDERPVAASFTFPNVDRKIGQTLRRLIDPIEITIEVISAADANTVIRVAPRLQLRSVDIKPDVITGQLSGIDYTAEPLGTKNVVPSLFPGLFRLRA